MTPKKKDVPPKPPDDLLRARLRHNEAVFRLLVEAVREYAIFMLDPQGVISSWNRGAERLKGYRADEIIGQHFSRFYPETVPRSGIDAELDIAIQAGVFRDEGWRVRQDGTLFWADVTITPVYDKTTLLGFAKVTRDLTDRKRAEEERAARAAAERTDRLKDEFLATLSHELRTPLNAIVGWAHVLQQDTAPDTVRRAAQVIARNAQVQTQLIADILDVQRLATGKLRLNIRDVDPVRIVEAAIETVRPAADARGIHVAAILDTTSGHVGGDQERLQQIVWNLLSNAIKFTPRGGRVTARLMRVDSSMEIAIEDTGPGIEPEFMPHIFDRFRQRDSSITREHGGLGLGLSIVKSLTELHGGRVTAANRAGGGAVFTVRLPLGSVSRAEQHVAPPEDPLAWVRKVPTLSGVTVLVVDDEADGRDVVATVLERCGAEVLTASSAREGFNVLVRTRPHVVVCDIGMPEEDGYTFIERVRGLSPTAGGLTPAAALTALATTEDRMRALRAGYQIHVPKPVQPAELVTVVASLTGNIRRLA